MMKKLWLGLLCVTVLLTAVACGTDEPTQQPDTTTSSVQEGDVTTDPSQGSDTTTAGQTDQTDKTNKTDKGDKTDKTNKTTVAPSFNNVVDGDVFFGSDDTTTTKKGETTAATKPTKPTTTKKPTTTAPTQKPTTIDKVTLPAVGTDVDGRGRLAVSHVELSKGVLTLKIRNNTDKQTQKLITEETNYVTYACYDKNGKTLTSKDQFFGYFYIGCLEVGQEVEFKVTLPEGTVRVELTGSKIVYWTPWA